MRVFKKLALSLGLAAAALAPAMPSVAAEVTTLRFSQWMPPGHFIVTNMFEPWAQEVEKATEGRVKVEFINALGKPQAGLTPEEVNQRVQTWIETEMRVLNPERYDGPPTTGSVS